MILLLILILILIISGRVFFEVGHPKSKFVCNISPINHVLYKNKIVGCKYVLISKPTLPKTIQHISQDIAVSDAAMYFTQDLFFSKTNN